MANACIAYTNLVDTASAITATSSNLLLPVSNITNPHIARKWRGTTPGADSIIIDMGSPVSFDTICAFGLTGSTITIKASMVDPTGAAGEVTSNADTVDQNYKSKILLTDVSSARYFRIDMTDYSGGSVEIGRVFIGLKTQFSYNFVKGWSRSWNDTSLRSKTRGGQTQIFPDSVFRTIEVSFDFLTQSDRDGFVEYVDRVNALKTDVLFITDPSSPNLPRDSVWGLMTTITPVVQPSVSLFTKQYTIEERL
jgi:hypothetical protein